MVRRTLHLRLRLLNRLKDLKSLVLEITINVRDVYVSAGAGCVVVLTGAVMTMPGLPKEPAAYQIDVTNEGVITGLF